MIQLGEHVRLTQSELTLLRQKAAKQGNVVTTVKTADELLDAQCAGTSIATIDVLLNDFEEFVATGSSPVIRKETNFSALREQYDALS